jgi:hypothetical protein
MDEKDVTKYLENQKLHKLAGRALRGEKLEGLGEGEKALIAFYSMEFITQAWSKELADMQKLISEELDRKLNDTAYSFNWDVTAKKDLILLNKINILFDTLKMLKPHIDIYWNMLDANRDATMSKHEKETTYILAYRVTLRLLLDRTATTQAELQDVIKAKFRWPQEQMEEATQIAGDTAKRNMQKYIAQMNNALGV